MADRVGVGVIVGGHVPHALTPGPSPISWTPALGPLSHPDPEGGTQNVAEMSVTLVIRLTGNTHSWSKKKERKRIKLLEHSRHVLRHETQATGQARK